MTFLLTSLLNVDCATTLKARSKKLFDERSSAVGRAADRSRLLLGLGSGGAGDEKDASSCGVKAEMVGRVASGLEHNTIAGYQVAISSVDGIVLSPCTPPSCTSNSPRSLTFALTSSAVVAASAETPSFFGGTSAPPPAEGLA